LVENREFSYPCTRRARYGVPRQNIAITFGVEKPEFCGYPTVKIFFMICAAVSTQYRRVRDGRTERRTDSLRQYSLRYAYASRGKNYPIFMKFCRTMHILTATTVN